MIDNAGAGGWSQPSTLGLGMAAVVINAKAVRKKELTWWGRCAVVSHWDHHSVVVVIDNNTGVCGKRAVATLVQGLAWVCGCRCEHGWMWCVCVRACMTYVWDYMNMGGDAGRGDVQKMQGMVQLGQMALETGQMHWGWPGMQRVRIHTQGDAYNTNRPANASAMQDLPARGKTAHGWARNPRDQMNTTCKVLKTTWIHLKMCQ